jgi:hypothetical protein
MKISYAFRVYLSPQTFSLASIALMQQASRSLTHTLYHIYTADSSFREILEKIKELYNLENWANKQVDGEVSYPLENDESRGMEVKFEYVIFAPP